MNVSGSIIGAYEEIGAYQIYTLLHTNDNDIYDLDLITLYEFYFILFFIDIFEWLHGTLEEGLKNTVRRLNKKKNTSKSVDTETLFQITPWRITPSQKRMRILENNQVIPISSPEDNDDEPAVTSRILKYICKRL
jgi:hypothetical protein